MKIPKSFKVFASTINVGFDNVRLSNEGAFGDCSFADGQINICNEYRGEKISDCCALDTFYHEKVHIILDAMGEHDLSKQEKFVEVFARLLRQSDQSAEF
jgi:hypothetical protein